MPLSRLGMVLQQAGFQSKRVDRLTADTLSPKYTHTRVCVRFINEGVRRQPSAHPTSLQLRSKAAIWPRRDRDLTDR